jgi:hypothetical protein|tara:strand:+ start:9363 stop:9557 length:195 start_codon:yes stop_codon:yes gene_type:complete
MKLSKIILEDKTIVARTEVDMSNDDINKLTESITNQLEEFLDTGNRDLIRITVATAINELLQNK